MATKIPLQATKIPLSKRPTAATKIPLITL
jgi:hypothetical protein